MDKSWILWALLACFSNTGRDLFIKKKYTASPHLVVSSTRFIAFFFLLLLMPFFYRDFGLQPDKIWEFSGVLLVTVVLTIVATVLKIEIIQKEEISKSSPLLSLTPIFIIPWATILLGEQLTPWAFAGLMTAMVGVILIMRNEQKLIYRIVNRFTLYILIILLIYGLTTVLDKIAIGYSNAYTYTLIWTGSSAFVGMYVVRLYGFKKTMSNSFSTINLFQSFLWAIGFFAQQIAIQKSYGFDMNTAFIKSILYIGIIINVLLGGKIFREQRILVKLLGAIIIVAGNMIILFMG